MKLLHRVPRPSFYRGNWEGYSLTKPPHDKDSPVTINRGEHLLVAGLRDEESLFAGLGDEESLFARARDEESLFPETRDEESLLSPIWRFR